MSDPHPATTSPGAGARSSPWLGWYGDDFTGATDTLATVADAHWRTLLFLDVPTPTQLALVGPLDAIGIAGAARSMDPEAMQIELEPVGQFFADLRVPVLHYKVCSTFDSAPATGNIGTAIRTLRPYVANAFVPIVGGQPNIERFCVFSNLYAAAGAGREVHRIDRHPTMSRHPVTPMRESDLRFHLAEQGLADVGAIHYPAYHRSDALQDALLDAELARMSASDSDAIRCVLFDIADPSHLKVVGRLIWQRALQKSMLAVGASGVVQALMAHVQDAANGATDGYGSRRVELTPAQGPVFALSGSLSPVTARQIDAATAFERIAADAGRLGDDPAYVDRLVGQAVAGLRSGRNLLVHTRCPSHDLGTTITPPARRIAQSTAAVVSQVVTRMAQIAPLRRIGVAGGDTSSHVAQALGLWGLSHHTTMAAGVTLIRAHSANPALDGLEMMLKGGQMGPQDILERLVRGA